VRYQFSTSGGDVQFSTRFVSGGGAEEDVLQAARVPSDVEPYAGNFKAPREGTLLLRFDNSFSWFTSKLLSYQVELYQPAFTLADTARCMQSRSLLSATAGDTRRAEVALHASQQALGSLGQEIPLLESRLAALQAQLGEKRARLQAAYREAEETSARIEANLDKRNGLCLRCVRGRGAVLSPYYVTNFHVSCPAAPNPCPLTHPHILFLLLPLLLRRRVLNKALLQHTLQFLGPASAARATCKYWRALLGAAA